MHGSHEGSFRLIMAPLFPLTGALTLLHTNSFIMPAGRGMAPKCLLALCSSFGHLRQVWLGHVVYE